MMKKLIAIILISIYVIGPALAQQAELDDSAIQEKVRFAPLHIYIDSGQKSLAAYQFELTATTGQIKIVGVESGEHPAFQNPPYYDTAARNKGRIIIAAFNTGRDLPKGRTRIATIHLQIIGDTEPEYKLDLSVAADSDAKKIPAQISFEKGE